MAPHSITQEGIQHAAQVLDGFFTRLIITLQLFGMEGRHRGIERLLPYLVAKGKLIAYPYQKKLVYIVPRLAKNRNIEYRIPHGLGCSECKVRLWHADRSAEFVPERRFRGFNVWPDVGFLYPNQWLLMVEFSTEDNAKRLGVLRNKVNRYLQVIREKQQVLFVLDLPVDKVYKVVENLPSHEALWYVDFATFKSVRLGDQLLAPIYINGGNRDVLPLRSYGH